MKKIFKTIFSAMPNNRIKKYLYTLYKKIRNRSHRKQLYSKGLLIDDKIIKFKTIRTRPRSIVVHLHLYYKDLLHEFIEYLSNIPFVFDLLVSVPKGTDLNSIESELKNVKKISKIIVRESPNIGRNFGPMYVLFGKDILQYDYLLHIHSKKSLENGFEVAYWRKHLLDYLLGSKKIVNDYISMFEKTDIALAYPNPLPGEHWVHTYLGVKDKAINLCNKLNIKFEDKYLNFSTGSMFWCKTSLLRNLFQIYTDWHSFIPTKPYNLEHESEYLLERFFDPLLKQKKLSFAAYYPDNRIFVKNKSSMNLDKYKRMDKFCCIKNIEKNNPNSLSFSIFGSLINFLIPVEQINELILKNPGTLEICSDISFINFWKKNRLKFGAPDKFYLYISKKFCINAENINKLKLIEQSFFEKYTCIREDVFYIYNYFLSHNKTIYLINDTSVSDEIVECILKSKMIFKYKKLYNANINSLKKDDLSFWKMFLNLTSSNYHVGSDEETDAHLLAMLKQPFCHIISSDKLFYLLYNNDFNYRFNCYDTYSVNIMINRFLCNSPFQFSKSSNEIAFFNLLVSIMLTLNYELNFIMFDKEKIINILLDKITDLDANNFKNRLSAFIDQLPNHKKEVNDTICELRKFNVGANCSNEYTRWLVNNLKQLIL